jgi:tRNA (cytidine/uridine-2'-O-)-methyltransferase
MSRAANIPWVLFPSDAEPAIPILDEQRVACYPHDVDESPLLNIVLYEPEIPQNAGNIGRTCVAVGARLWFVRPLGFRLEDRQLRRAGLDYWEFLDWQAVDDWRELVNTVASQRYWYFSKFAQREYWEADFHPQDVLVFGSESRGLPKSLVEGAADRCLRIPMRPDVRSLNLAASVAVGAYEALRQIRSR